MKDYRIKQVIFLEPNGEETVVSPDICAKILNGEEVLRDETLNFFPSVIKFRNDEKEHSVDKKSQHFILITYKNCDLLCDLRDGSIIVSDF